MTSASPSPGLDDGENRARQLEAESLASEILRQNPDDLGALHALGLVRYQLGQLDSAIELLEQAVLVGGGLESHRKLLATTLDQRAKIAADQREFSNALPDLERAIELDQANVAFLAHLAFVQSELRRPDDALTTAERALHAAPDDPQALNAKGLALRGLGQTDAAIDCFEKALSRAPDLAAAHVNLGLALAGRGDRTAALEHLHAAVRLEPENVHALNNLGNALVEARDLNSAEKYLRTSIAVAPEFAEAHFNLAMALLIQGKFEDGWPEYEWRWRCLEFPSTRRAFRYPIWQGEDLSEKTIVIWSEQGVGDEIMFANPLPDVSRSGANVLIECNPRFVPIFSRSYPDARVVARSDPPDPVIDQAKPDYQIPMASLCFHYRRGRAKFPDQPGHYLTADPDRVAACRHRYEKLGDGAIVGISWRSGNPIVGHERSAELSLWDEILGQPDCQFVSLQYGEVEADLESVRERLGIDVYTDGEIDPFSSMDDWLAQVAAMDLVISVDNSTVQVSGALGVPTWTMLSYVPEWRWLAEGNDSPWHPKMTVLRQAQPGEWNPVIAAAATALEAYLAGR